MEKTCAYCHTGKTRSPGEVKSLQNRLSRIGGQVRGLSAMLDKEAYCPDILHQVAAVRAALQGFERALLASHIRTCVVSDIQAGRADTVEELLSTLESMMR